MLVNILFLKTSAICIFKSVETNLKEGWEFTSYQLRRKQYWLQLGNDIILFRVIGGKVLILKVYKTIHAYSMTLTYIRSILRSLRDILYSKKSKKYIKTFVFCNFHV